MQFNYKRGFRYHSCQRNIPRPKYHIVHSSWIQNNSQSNHSGGLMLLIKCSIEFTQLDSFQTQLFECASVTIHAQEPFVSHVIYCPGATGDQVAIGNHFLHDITALCTGTLPFFIIGDFNSKHRAWNCARNTKRGKLLFESPLVHQEFCHLYRPTTSLSNSKSTP